MLPELYTRVLLAIVGPVDSVNLWKTIFGRAMDCASAQTVSWFANIFIGYAAKNREPPKSPSLQNLDVLRSTIAGQGVFPAQAGMIR